MSDSAPGNGRMQRSESNQTRHNDDKILYTTFKLKDCMRERDLAQNIGGNPSSRSKEKVRFTNWH